MAQDLVDVERALKSLATAYQFSLTVFRRHMYLSPSDMEEAELKQLIDKLQIWTKGQQIEVEEALSCFT